MRKPHKKLIIYTFYFQVAMAGDFILAVASMMIARLRNNDVTLVLSQVKKKNVILLSIFFKINFS